VSGNKLVKDELDRIWKEVAIVYFMMLSQHLCKYIEKKSLKC
jgi:hypothetical protein